MPEQSFTVHVDPDDLARQTLAAAVAPLPVAGGGSVAGGDPVGSGSVAGGDPDRPVSVPGGRHGAREDRAGGRARPERQRSSRAAAGSGRSYAFRRS